MCVCNDFRVEVGISSRGRDDEVGFWDEREDSAVEEKSDARRRSAKALR
jgi:hypothetical protein